MVKNIVITPADARIDFSGLSANPMYLSVENDGTISFYDNSGVVFQVGPGAVGSSVVPNVSGVPLALSSRTIGTATGSGISGGGSLAANRSLVLDISGITTGTPVTTAHNALVFTDGAAAKSVRTWGQVISDLGIWTLSNDGASSGLDADLLDGQQGTYFLNLANATGTILAANLPATLAAIQPLTAAADKIAYYTGASTAAITTLSSHGRSLIAGADAAATRATIGLTIGTNVQAHDTELDAIAGLVSAADTVPYFTGPGTAALTPMTSFARTFLDDVSGTEVRATLGLVIGTDVQGYGANLQAISGLTSAANKLAYFTGSGTAALTDLSAFVRTILDDVDAAAVQTTLGMLVDTDITLAANSDIRVASQKATKVYIDNIFSGVKWKREVVAATVSPGTLASSFENGDTVDGIVLATNDRLLIKDQTTQSENGIYIVQASGAPVRSTDADIGSELANAVLFVTGGTVNGGSQWRCTNSTVTIGVTNVTFSQISGSGTYVAGTGLTLTGNSFAISDAELLAIAGLTSAANKLAYFTGSGTAALTDFSAFGRTLVDDADALTARSTLGVVIGTDVQAYHSNLAALAGVSASANRLPYFDSGSTMTYTVLGSFGRSLIDDADAAAARTTLGLGTSATVNTGSAGATIPLLNAYNNFSNNVDFTGANVGITGILAVAQVGVTGPFAISSTAPRVDFDETDQTTDQRRWRIQATNGVLNVDTVNDAYSTATNIISITRSGLSPTAIASTVPINVNASYFRVQSNDPFFYLHESDGGTNEKVWRHRAAASIYYFDVANDSYASPSTIFQVSRTGAVPGLISFQSAAQFNSTATFTGTTEISNSSPGIRFYESDAGTDAKRWLFVADAGVFRFQVRNDADNTGTDIFAISRSTTTPTNINVTPPVTLLGSAGSSSTGPFFGFDKTNASSNQRHWRFIGATDGRLDLQTINDAYNSASNVFSFTRSGQTPSQAISAVPVVPSSNNSLDLGASGTKWRTAYANYFDGAQPVPKTLVIFGSSNAAGVGASTYSADPTGPSYTSPSTSWAGLLTSALSGWTVWNRSISGNGTTDLINRFWTDVAIYRPSHVILCSALHNDSYNVTNYIRGINQLIDMVRSIGAIPIVRGASPYNSATTAEYNAMLDAQRQLDLLGVWQIDALSTLVDHGATGDFIASTTYHVGDGLHCNDAGYAALFAAIDLGMFLSGAPEGPGHHKPSGTWLVPAGSSAGDAMLLDQSNGLRSSLKSFTMRARIGNTMNSIAAAAFMSAWIHGTGNAPTRVRNPSVVFAVVQGDGAAGVDSTLNSQGNFETHDHVIVFRRELASPTLYYYIDGSLIGSFTVAGTGGVNDVAKFVFGSRETSPAAEFRYSECQLWSVPLSADQVASMSRNGYRPAAGLIFDAVMSSPASVSGGKIMNRVQNGTLATSGLTWSAYTETASHVPATISETSGASYTYVIGRDNGRIKRRTHSSAMTDTLPVATTAGTGTFVTIRNVTTAYDITVSVASAGTIDGVSSMVVAPGQSRTFRVRNTEWTADPVTLDTGKRIYPTPAAGWKETITTGCSPVAEAETTTNKIAYAYLAFSGSTDQYAYAVISVPPSYQTGSMEFRVRWTATAGTAAQTVIWGMQARGFVDDDALDQAYGTAATVTDAYIAAGDMHVSAWTAFTPSNDGADRQMMVRIYRDADTDTHTNPAHLIGVDFRWVLSRPNDLV